MTDLKQLAEIALRMGRKNLKEEQTVGLLVFFLIDGKVERLEGDDRVAFMLNSGELKDVLFEAIRRTAQQRGATAVIIGTEAWMGKSTEAARDVPREEIERLGREHKFETLVQMGMVERVEAIIATAQDKDSCVFVTQPFRRDADGNVYSYGDVEVNEVPQEQFEGRQKMFGDLSPEKLHEHRTSAGKI